MKKIYSLALMAMMAVCTMMLTSCGNDDEVSKDFTISISFSKVQSVTGISETTYATIKKFYQNLLGNDVNITYGTSTYAIITIQGAESKKEAAVNAVKNTDKDALTNALKEAGCTETFTFEAYDGSETYLTFSYTVAAKDMLNGKTWVTTFNKVKYTFVVEDKLYEDSKYRYKATMTEGDKTYEGFFTDYGGESCVFTANPLADGENTPLTFQLEKSNITTTQFKAQLTSTAYNFMLEDVTFTVQ